MVDYLLTIVNYIGHYHTIGTVTTGLRRFLPIRYGRNLAFKTHKCHGPFMDAMLKHSNLINAHGHLFQRILIP